MADVGIRLVFDDSDMTEGYQRVKQQMTDLNNSQEEVNKTIQDGFKEGADASKDYSNKTKEATDETKKLAAETEQARQGLLAQAKAVSIFGVSIQDIEDKMKKWAATQKLVTASVGRTSTALKVLKVALISTGIGAIVVALGSMVALLAKTQKGLDFVSKVAASLGAVLDNVTDSLIAVGNGIVKLFKGDFKGALQEANRAGQELKNTGEDVKKAWDLKDQSNQLRDFNIRLRREIATTRTEIKALNLVAEDTTKSIKEREEAARKAGALERGLLDKRLQAANKEISILQERQALSENVAADEERLTELIEAKAAIEQESLELQTTINNKLNTIRQEGIRAVEAQQKRLEDLTKTISEQAKAIELQQLHAVERLNAEWELSKDGIEKVRKETIDLAKSLGKTEDEISQLNDQFDILQENTDRSYQVKIDLALVDGTEALKGVQSSIDNIPERDTPELTIGIATPDTQTMLDDVKDGVEGFLDGLGDFFTSDQFQASLQLAVSITDAFLSGIDLQIQKLDELIATRDENISKLEQDLEREEELNDKGLANNLESIERQIEQERVLREQALKERQELQQKAQIAQIALDTVAQAENLVTASTQIFKAFSGIPFVGVPLAIAAIGAMFAAFAKVKVDAINATKLYTGAERIGDYTGYVDRGGASDKPGRGSRGYRMVDIATGKPTQAIVGGNEMLLSEDLTHSVGHIMMDAQKNPSLRQQMVDWYANKDSSIGFAQGVARMQSYNLTTVGITDAQLKRVMTKVMDDHFSKYKSYKDSIPRTTVIPPKSKVITETASKKSIVNYT